jgi:hypothetical protein
MVFGNALKNLEESIPKLVQPEGARGDGLDD